VSSTLSITDKAAWMPQAWIFDAALTRIRPLLDGADSELEAAVESALVVDVLNLKRLPPGAHASFSNAAARALDELFSEPPAQLGGADEHVWVAWALSELVALLRVELGLPDAGSGARTLVLPGGAWSAPAVVFDLTVEHLAVWLLAHTTWSDRAVGLLASRSRATTSRATDDPMFDATDADGSVRAACEAFLASRAGQDRVWVSPKLADEIGPALKQLQELL
jgi:hypothetical protein